MGSKGSTAPPPSVAPMSGSNMNEMMPMMMAMMQSMGQQMPMMPQQLDTPDITSTEPIDWAAKQDELDVAAKARNATAKRKGRLSTIHSSMTDSGEETEMTTSLLGDA